jgi:hypothetical protein
MQHVSGLLRMPEKPRSEIVQIKLVHRSVGTKINKSKYEQLYLNRNKKGK